MHKGDPQSESSLTGTNRYTCGGRFGSLGYEEIDAKTYAEWGIDYLSEILCFSFFVGLVLNSRRDQSMTTAITKVRAELRSFRSTGMRKCRGH